MLQWMWFKCRTFWNCFKLWLWFWAHCRACKLPCSSCQHFGWLDTPLTHKGYFTTKNSNGHLPFFYGSFKCLIRLLDSQRSEKWKELEQERFDNAPIEGYNIPNVGAIQTSLSKSSRTSIAFFEVHCWRQLEITWLPGSDLTVSIAVSGLMLRDPWRTIYSIHGSYGYSPLKTLNGGKSDTVIHPDRTCFFWRVSCR